MAKITITISDDTSVEGKVNLAADFDPPIEPGTTSEQMTAAQVVALELVSSSMKHAKGKPRRKR